MCVCVCARAHHTGSILGGPHASRHEWLDPGRSCPGMLVVIQRRYCEVHTWKGLAEATELRQRCSGLLFFSLHIKVSRFPLGRVALCVGLGRWATARAIPLRGKQMSGQTKRGPAGTFLASGARGGISAPGTWGEEVLMADGWNPEGGASVQGAGAVSDWPLGRELKFLELRNLD